VLYLVAPGVEHALQRALERARAGERIVAVPLAAVPRSPVAPMTAIVRTVAGDA
jgi:hypothetical protein